MAKKTVKPKIAKKAAENVNFKKTAKDAYEEFQRHANSFKDRASEAAESFQTVFPPQFNRTNKPFVPHQVGTAMPRQMPSMHYNNKESLTGKVESMIRLGVDFINAGLAGGVTVLNGLSGSNGCGCSDEGNFHGYSGHHSGYSDCCSPSHNSISGCCSDDHHGDDCDYQSCCQPSVNGCC